MIGRHGASLNELEALYRTRFDVFARVAVSVMGDPERARDAVQEAFATAVRKRRSFRNDGPLEDALQLVNLYAERGSPKYQKAAMRWLERYLTEGSPRLQHFAEITAGLARKDLGQLIGIEEARSSAPC